MEDPVWYKVIVRSTTGRSHTHPLRLLLKRHTISVGMEMAMKRAEVGYTRPKENSGGFDITKYWIVFDHINARDSSGITTIQGKEPWYVLLTVEEAKLCLFTIKNDKGGLLECDNSEEIEKLFN